MDRKITIIMVLVAICIFLLGMTYNNWKLTGKVINEEIVNEGIIEILNNSNEEIEEQSIENEETFIEEKVGTLECVVIIKENGMYNPLKLINHTGIENIGSVDSIAIGGYDYLKNRYGGSGLQHIYDGIQCIKDNGWILTSYESDGIFIREKSGRLYLFSESFIEENGYFTMTDNMKVTCCRIN